MAAIGKSTRLDSVAMARFAARLERYLADSGTSKSALCLMAGISRPSLYNVLSANPGTKVKILERICDAIGVELSDMVKRG